MNTLKRKSLGEGIIKNSDNINKLFDLNKVNTDKKSTFTNDNFSDVTSIMSTNSNNTSNKNKNSKCAKFKLFRELKEDQKKLLRESLFRALLVKNIQFNDDLTYPDSECTPEMNNAFYEPGLQLISDQNKEVYLKFKEKTRRGEYPPIEVIDDEIQVI
jgi:hypothetical protein